MAQIRHLAILTEDPERLAEFYVNVFGLKSLHRGSHPGHLGKKTVHLTDELAILDNDEQQSRSGLYHFGIQVDNMEEILNRVKKHEPEKRIRKRPAGTPFAEVRVADPDGNFMDISDHGFLDYKPLK